MCSPGGKSGLQTESWLPKLLTKSCSCIPLLDPGEPAAPLLHILSPPTNQRSTRCQIPANENARKSQQGGTVVHWASKAQGAVAHRLEPAHGFHGVLGSAGHRIFQSLVSPPVILHHFYLFLIWYLKCFTFLCCVDSF